VAAFRFPVVPIGCSSRCVVIELKIPSPARLSLASQGHWTNPSITHGGVAISDMISRALLPGERLPSAQDASTADEALKHLCVSIGGKIEFQPLKLVAWGTGRSICKKAQGDADIAFGGPYRSVCRGWGSASKTRNSAPSSRVKCFRGPFWAAAGIAGSDQARTRRPRGFSISSGFCMETLKRLCH